MWNEYVHNGEATLRPLACLEVGGCTVEGKFPGGWREIATVTEEIACSGLCSHTKSLCSDTKRVFINWGRGCCGAPWHHTIMASPGGFHRAERSCFSLVADWLHLASIFLPFYHTQPNCLGFSATDGEEEGCSGTHLSRVCAGHLHNLCVCGRTHVCSGVFGFLSEIDGV